MKKKQDESKGKEKSRADVFKELMGKADRHGEKENPGEIAPKPEEIGKSPRIRSVRIERMKNGWTTSLDHEPMTTPEGTTSPIMHQPEQPVVHTSKKDLMAHLDECLED